MNCSLAHEWLQRSLDGESVDESPRWLAHLRECPDCAVLAEAAQRLRQGLQRWPNPSPPRGLEARIVETIFLDRRRRMRRRWVTGFALAAGIVLALIVRFHGMRLSPSIERVPDESASVPLLPKEETAPTLRDSAAELGEVFTSLTSQTANETVEQTRRWVSQVPSPTLPKVDLLSAESTARPLREAGQGVSEGLEPVTNSARRAVGLFLRELPPMDAEPNGL